MMREKTKQGVVYLTYPAFDARPEIRHGFSTRLGGVSAGEWTSMNLSYTRGDDPACVTENFHRICHAIGIPFDRVVCSDQTHTTNVHVVTEEDAGCGLVKKRTYHDVDGLITNSANLPLATFYADCVPLYFYDPIHHAIGLSHSGWRGTVGRMGAVTLSAMQREYGTDPTDVLAAIGPSICQNCYEVSADVAEAFAAAFSEAPYQIENIQYQKPDGKYQLDLWEANRQILLSAGIREESLSMPEICTCCNPDYLFSHRASHGKRGNLAAFLMLC